MAQKAPGKHYRQEISLVQAMAMFADEKKSEQWFVQTRWPHGIHCPHCESDRITEQTSHPQMPYRCKACRKFFSVRTGTVMHASNLKFQVWGLAMYLLTTGIKGTSSMKLHRAFGITQKAAWRLAHRIRETWTKNASLFAGPVEVDETFIGGLEKNKHAQKRLNKGRGTVGKTAVVGVKDRTTNKVKAKVVADVGRSTLQGFVQTNTEAGATVYTDDHRSYLHMHGFEHTAVKHSVKEYMKGMAHTNGIESFWAGLKRGYHGTYHHMSGKHLHRYIGEFAGRHNGRPLNTVEQMKLLSKDMVGKRLRYKDLIASS